MQKMDETNQNYFGQYNTEYINTQQNDDESAVII